MEEKDDWTCGREGDRHPFTEINLQDEFVTPITLVLNYKESAEQPRMDLPFQVSSGLIEVGKL